MNSLDFKNVAMLKDKIKITKEKQISFIKKFYIRIGHIIEYYKITNKTKIMNSLNGISSISIDYHYFSLFYQNITHRLNKSNY